MDLYKEKEKEKENEYVFNGLLIGFRWFMV